MTEQHPYAAMDREYREKKAAIRADGDLTYEAKERHVRALRLEHNERRKAAERAESERLEAAERESYRKAVQGHRDRCLAGAQGGRGTSYGPL